MNARSALRWLFIAAFAGIAFHGIYTLSDSLRRTEEPGLLFWIVPFGFMVCVLAVLPMIVAWLLFAKQYRQLGSLVCGIFAFVVWNGLAIYVPWQIAIESVIPPHGEPGWWVFIGLLLLSAWLIVPLV